MKINCQLAGWRWRGEKMLNTVNSAADEKLADPKRRPQPSKNNWIMVPGQENVRHLTKLPVAVFFFFCFLWAKVGVAMERQSDKWPSRGRWIGPTVPNEIECSCHMAYAQCENRQGNQKDEHCHPSTATIAIFGSKFYCPTLPGTKYRVHLSNSRPPCCAVCVLPANWQTKLLPAWKQEQKRRKNIKKKNNIQTQDSFFATQNLLQFALHLHTITLIANQLQIGQNYQYALLFVWLSHGHQSLILRVLLFASVGNIIDSLYICICDTLSHCRKMRKEICEEIRAKAQWHFQIHTCIFRCIKVALKDTPFFLARRICGYKSLAELIDQPVSPALANAECRTQKCAVYRKKNFYLISHPAQKERESFILFLHRELLVASRRFS